MYLHLRCVFNPNNLHAMCFLYFLQLFLVHLLKKFHELWLHLKAANTASVWMNNVPHFWRILLWLCCINLINCIVSSFGLLEDWRSLLENAFNKRSRGGNLIKRSRENKFFIKKLTTLNSCLVLYNFKLFFPILRWLRKPIKVYTCLDSLKNLTSRKQIKLLLRKVNDKFNFLCI